MPRQTTIWLVGARGRGQGRIPPTHPPLPQDYLTSLRQRRAELYAKVGRAEIADRSFYLETAQLHPEDLDRQREFESWAQSRLDLKIFDI